MNLEILSPVRHGLVMAVTALIIGALWAGFMASQHATLHTGFETQAAAILQTHPHHTTYTDVAGNAHKDESTRPHSHSGSIATDAMDRLLRGHIHFMGLGILTAALLLVTALTTLKPCWKRLLGWSFGIGALAYPPAWIVMGFRTVTLGPDAAEASIMWLFVPAVGVLLLSMGALLFVLLVEWIGWQRKGLISHLFSN